MSFQTQLPFVKMSGQQRSHRQPRHRTPRQLMLAAVAKETLDTLPAVLKELPHIKADESTMYDFRNLSNLNSAKCPSLSKAPTKVVNQDSFNAALDLMAGQSPGSQARKVAVLNLASHKSPGGGWLGGATAQEEALCYRSSLALSLHKKYYPWKMNQGLYTQDVVIIRTAMDNEHKLLIPDVKPVDLPVVSVISIAGFRRPEKKTINVTDGDKVTKKEVFADPDHRELTKNKMRLSLRIAAVNGHRALVLGALGCGAFANPVQEVADCWLEVLSEAEFSGGWWEEICFAVYDRKNEGNFEIFRKTLEGQKA